MATPDCWTRSVESPTGIHVRVYEPTPGGVLHIAIRGPGLEPLRQSLRHRDKDRAEAQARAELLRLERRVAPATLELPHLASYWLTRAYRLEGIPKPDGGLWHPFRRKWVTDRADLPLKALAATGGWDDAPTMLRSYMHPDEDQLRSVINYRKPGRSQGPAREFHTR